MVQTHNVKWSLINRFALVHQASPVMPNTAAVFVFCVNVFPLLNAVLDRSVLMALASQTVWLMAIAQSEKSALQHIVLFSVEVITNVKDMKSVRNQDVNLAVAQTIIVQINLFVQEINVSIRVKVPLLAVQMLFVPLSIIESHVHVHHSLLVVQPPMLDVCANLLLVQAMLIVSPSLVFSVLEIVAVLLAQILVIVLWMKNVPAEDVMFNVQRIETVHHPKFVIKTLALLAVDRTLIVVSPILVSTIFVLIHVLHQLLVEQTLNVLFALMNVFALAKTTLPVILISNVFAPWKDVN